jgi:hypothetical protein
MPKMKSARRPGSSALTPTVMAEVARVILSSSTMMPMVALSENSPLPSKTAHRARGATLSCASRLPAALKSSSRIELGRFTYDACRRLGLCATSTTRPHLESIHDHRIVRKLLVPEFPSSGSPPKHRAQLLIDQEYRQLGNWRHVRSGRRECGADRPFLPVQIATIFVAVAIT